MRGQHADRDNYQVGYGKPLGIGHGIALQLRLHESLPSGVTRG
jgi:hypothetical protein